jgi:ATP-binding cassette subfamily B protein
MLVAMVYVMARIDAYIAAVAITVLPLIVISGELYRKRARMAWTEVKAHESLAMSVVQEVLGAIRVVKAFGQEEREVSRFHRSGTKSFRSQVRAVLVEAFFGVLMAMSIALGTAMALWLGVRHVQQGTLSLGDLLVVTAYLAQMYKPLETLGKKLGTMQASFVSAERTFSLLDELPEVRDYPRAKRLLSARGHIALRNVGFAYDRERPVLCGVSFEVEPGTRVGISGPTGAGKSTLISLLPRFYDPSEGAVLLDGVDIRQYELRDLRRQFAIVLQEPVLLSGSIGENIAYGRPEATNAEIMAAAEHANAHGFIKTLPEGYQTKVGDRGIRLSGGERQRISIARAFLRNSPILLLDEPTSSVDYASEAAIIDAMERLMESRTTFMIAHRLNTLDACDLRLIVRQGEVGVFTQSHFVEVGAGA